MDCICYEQHRLLLVEGNTSYELIIPVLTYYMNVVEFCLKMKHFMLFQA